MVRVAKSGVGLGRDAGDSLRGIGMTGEKRGGVELGMTVMQRSHF